MTHIYQTCYHRHFHTEVPEVGLRVPDLSGPGTFVASGHFHFLGPKY